MQIQLMYTFSYSIVRPLRSHATQGMGLCAKHKGPTE
eukprot:UN04960